MKPTGSYLLGHIPKRRPDGHKGSYKKVLVVAGSRGMSGAAYLSALAALKTGAGLVRILTPECNRTILQTSLPEAVLSTYREESLLCREKDGLLEIRELAGWADILLLGPGLGQGDHVPILMEEILSGEHKRTILDADALNSLSNHPFLYRYLHSSVVVTPHIKEMGRLMGEEAKRVGEDKMAYAVNFRNTHGVTCVLKSDKTVIATTEGDVFCHSHQVPALSKAGSGDVLAGILAGIFSIGTPEGMAAAVDVWIHGAAGRAAAAVFGEHGVIARDIIDHIPPVMKQREQEVWKEQN